MAWAEAPQWSSTRPSISRRRQLKRGIELRGLAETVDERLELLHGPLRITLGEERPGVLPLVGGGFSVKPAWVTASRSICTQASRSRRRPDLSR